MIKFSAYPVLNPIFLYTIRTLASATKMHQVFVYGTLKRQEPNNYWLLDANNGIGNYIAEGQTKTKYPLIIATRYNIPFLLYSPGKGDFVRGEVYEVDDAMLSKLDILEDHPNYYVRELDDIIIKNAETKKSETIKCWVYFLKNFKPELLKRPFMEEYSSKGSHGLIYMDRSKRDPLYNPKTEITPDKKSDEKKSEIKKDKDSTQ